MEVTRLAWTAEMETELKMAQLGEQHAAREADGRWREERKAKYAAIVEAAQRESERTLVCGCGRSFTSLGGLRSHQRDARSCHRPGCFARANSSYYLTWSK